MNFKTELEKAVKEEKEILMEVQSNGFNDFRYLTISELKYNEKEIYIRANDDSEIHIYSPKGIKYDDLEEYWEMEIENGTVIVSIVN